MMKRWLLVTLAVAACTDEAPIADHNCPCASGFVCCESNVCMPEGQACAVTEPVTSDFSALPCAWDDDQASDGTIDVHYDLVYDAAGNVTHYDGDYGSDGTIDETLDATYDAANQVLEVRSSSPSGPYLETYTYDALERVVTDDITVGDAHQLTTWTYDGLTATSEDASEGAVTRRCVFQQNAGGRPESGTCTSELLTTSSTYSYDDAGRLTLRETMDPRRDAPVRLERSYDAAGRLVLHILQSGGIVEFRATHTYDPDGRLIVSTSQFPGPDGINPATTSTFRYCR